MKRRTSARMLVVGCVLGCLPGCSVSFQTSTPTVANRDEADSVARTAPAPHRPTNTDTPVTPPVDTHPPVPEPLAASGAKAANWETASTNPAISAGESPDGGNPEREDAPLATPIRFVNTPGGSTSPSPQSPVDLSPSAAGLPAADGSAPATIATTPSAPRRPKVIPDDPAVTLDLTFDDIKFEIAKGAPFHRELIYADIERYQDRRIKIRGYILPGYQERGIQQFVLVRDNMECCFGPGAALYDCILVTMADQTISYTIRPVTVEGTFSIEPFEGPDGPLAIYRMQAQRVE